MIVGLGLFSVPTWAGTVTAVRPGVMCRHADALARLTLPDGSSRASRAGVGAAVLAVKSAGGCVDLIEGDQGVVVQAHRNTSIVQFAGRAGAAAGTYLIANVDFAPSSAATGAVTGSVDTPPTAPGPTADTSTSPPASPDPTIVGIALGMSPTEARSKLDPALTIQQRDLHDPRRDALVAFTDHGLIGKADPYEAFILEFVDDRLAYAKHVQVFGPGSEPVAASIGAALDAKYGQRRSGSPGQPDGEWAEDVHGRPYPIAFPMICFQTMSDMVMLRGVVSRTLPGGMTEMDTDADFVPREAPSYPLFDANQECGRVIEASSLADPANPSLITRLEVRMVRSAPFFAVDAERAAEAKKKLDDATKAAQSNHAHL